MLLVVGSGYGAARHISRVGVTMDGRSKKRALLALTVLALGTIASAPARAATTYEIEVGFEFPRKAGIPGYSSRFFPPSVKIHRGDTLHFKGAPGLLLPVGTGPTQFREENMIRLGHPYFPLSNDPDEGPGAMKLNFGAFSPTVEGCGAAEDPCHFDGTAVLNSGDEARQFNVRIDVAAPAVVWVHAGFGTQTMRIEVVGANDEASSQQDLDRRAAKLKRQDFETAAALHKRLSTRQTSHRRADGTRVVDAWGGYDHGPVNLIAFYPKRIRIRRGDVVQWHWNLENEVHSAAFSMSRAKSMLRNNFAPACDPDGDQGSAKDNPPEGRSQEDPPCNDMSQFEVDLDRRERNTPRGNGVFSGRKDYEYSGLRITESLQPGFGNEAPWNVRFRARAADKGWQYLCTIHGSFMSGTVIVR